MDGYRHYVEVSPFSELPSPPTTPEVIAAAMISEAHLKASELGADLGEHLTHALLLVEEVEMASRMVADGGPGDVHAAKIAVAMRAAGAAATQRLGYAGDLKAALHKLEMAPCPTCARPFSWNGSIPDNADEPEAYDGEGL